MVNKRRYKLLINISSILAPFTVLILVWFPEFYHYFVPGGNISASVIERSRSNPEKSVLEELSEMSLLETSITGLSAQNQADKILSGELMLPGKSSVRITLPFDSEDLNKSTPGWQLSFSGLSAVKILLDAFEESTQEHYFNQAKAMLLAWAEFEANTWLPKGFLWNDHAVAARLPVLSQFWHLYRSRHDFQSEVAQSILGFALRSAQMLAKPSQFTYATNHGVMQNLGLWHAATAFPHLPGTQNFQQIAFDRMEAQMKFYINNEGVVLEHSAGYQAHGVYFLGSALRYLSLLNKPIPEEWQIKYQKTKEFYADLVRPDGSIPVFGDTPRDHDASHTSTTEVSGNQALPLSRNNILAPQREFTIFPDAGYAILWSGLDNWHKESNIAQTVLVWSYFPGHGHKLADDMSILLWADGQDWWSNIGYWAYGQRYRQQAVSWHGSNAPHLVGEAANIDRNTRLRYYAKSNGMAAIDLERTDAGGFQPRRQVYYTGRNLWLVMDTPRDEQNRVAEHLWTTLPEVAVQNDPDSGGYWLVPPGDSGRMQVVLLGSRGVSVKRLSGSKEPFAGWIVMENQVINKTQTFLVRQPSNMSWSLAIWKLVNEKNNSVIALHPKMNQWSDPENWQVSVPMSSGETIMLERQQNSVYIHDNSGLQVKPVLKLNSGFDVAKEFSDSQHWLNKLAVQYERHKDLTYYRKRVTYLILAMWLLQEILLWRISRIHVKPRLRLVTVMAWAALGTWLHTIYFAS